MSVHHERGHRVQRVFVPLLQGGFSSLDIAYDEDLFYNEDDEHKNGKVLENLPFGVSSSNQSSDKQIASDNLREFFAKQVYIDYLLDEKISEKTTTSQ